MTELLNNAPPETSALKRIAAEIAQAGNNTTLQDWPVSEADFKVIKELMLNSAKRNMPPFHDDADKDLWLKAAAQGDVLVRGVKLVVK